MRLAIIGRDIPRTREIIEELLRTWKPEHVITIRRHGLGAFAFNLAEKLGIPRTNFWISQGVCGAAGGEAAALQAARVGRPDALVCLSPRSRDYTIMGAFRRCGVQVALGHFDKARAVTWVRL